MMKNDLIDKVKVGQRIRLIRLGKQLTLSEFGNLLDVKKSAVNNWEKGRNLPTKKKLEKIALLGNTSVDYILNGTKVNKIFEYLKNLLLLKFPNKDHLSDELCSYIDYREQHSKYLKYSIDKGKNNELDERRTKVLEDISKMTLERLENKKITAENIDNTLPYVFDDIENDYDKSNYGMLLETWHELNELRNRVDLMYRDPNKVDPILQKKLLNKIDDLKEYVFNKLNKTYKA